MNKSNNRQQGDQEAFDQNWISRSESQYIHWTRGEPQNQIQLAFRNHWILFNEIIGERFEGGRVLEVGCGRGTMSAYFADNGFKCTLLDSSEKIIRNAKEIFNKNGLKAQFDVGDANNLPYAEESFDLIFSIGLLEHFKEIENTISEQIRVLKKGGVFIGYIVPKYEENVQQEYNWINDIIKVMVGEKQNEKATQKEQVFRSDDGSKKYINTLENHSLINIKASGVYPLPMISYSIDFPFTLLNGQCEEIIVKHFQNILKKRKIQTGRNPWLCKEGFGQAFMVWGEKK